MDELKDFQLTVSPLCIGAEVLVRIAQRRLSGTLTWSEGGMECELLFREGRPELALFAGAQRMDSRDAVIGVVRGFAVVVSGQCKFSYQTHNVGEDLQIDTLGEVLMALLTMITPKQLNAVWSARGGYEVEVTKSFDRLKGVVAKMGGATIVKPLPNTSIGTLLAGADEGTQRGWAALLVLGGLKVTNAPESKIFESTIRPRAQTEAEITASKRVARKEMEDLKKEIERAHAEMEDKTHYEVLGVSEKSGEDAVRKAYFSMAKTWHTDRFANKGLDDHTMKLAGEVFRKCEEAHRVLSNEDEKKAYDFVLDRQAKGLPTDPKVIVDAEAIFRKAQALVRKGQADKAEPLLEEAVTLNKGEAEFWVYYGYATYCAKGRIALSEARDRIKKGLQMNSNLDSAHEFLGRIARVEGDAATAQKELRKALEINPRNVEAQRELRFVTMRDSKRQKKKGGGSFLSKVLKR